MLSQEKQAEILTDIEWAKLALEKGNAYQISWPKRYVEDCTILLDEILRLRQQVRYLNTDTYKRPL